MSEGPFPAEAVSATWSTSYEYLFSVYTQYYALSTYDGLDPDCFYFDI